MWVGVSGIKKINLQLEINKKKIFLTESTTITTKHYLFDLKLSFREIFSLELLYHLSKKTVVWPEDIRIYTGYMKLTFLLWAERGWGQVSFLIYYRY